MRKLIMLGIVGYLGYAYHQGSLNIPFLAHEQSPVISNQNPVGLISITQPTARLVSNARNSATTANTAETHNPYRCDGRQHCSQMSSYQEALFFLRNCPNTKMDGDGDGIPCEAQFRR